MRGVQVLAGALLTVCLLSPSADVVAAPSDGRRIVFVNNGDGDAEIFVVRPDGSGIRRLTDNSRDDTSPSWSPDGRHIIYTAEHNGQIDLRVMRSDGTRDRRVTRTPLAEIRPEWSPDGSRIAFSLSDGDGADLYVCRAWRWSRCWVPASGQENSSLTSPTWRGDSRRLAYADIYSWSGDIYTVRSCDCIRSDSHQVTSDDPFETDLVWRPTGPDLLFAREVVEEDAIGNEISRSYELFIVDVTTGAETRLTNTPSVDERAGGWAPSGNRVVYSADVDGDRDLYIMRFDTGAVRPLTDMPGDETEPDWL